MSEFCVMDHFCSRMHLAEWKYSLQAHFEDYFRPASSTNNAQASCWFLNISHQAFVGHMGLSVRLSMTLFLIVVGFDWIHELFWRCKRTFNMGKEVALQDSTRNSLRLKKRIERQETCAIKHVWWFATSQAHLTRVMRTTKVTHELHITQVMKI